MVYVSSFEDKASRVSPKVSWLLRKDFTHCIIHFYSYNFELCVHIFPLPLLVPRSPQVEPGSNSCPFCGLIDEVLVAEFISCSKFSYYAFGIFAFVFMSPSPPFAMFYNGNH